MKLRQLQLTFVRKPFFKVPFSNTFRTLKKIDFYIKLVLDVLEGVKLPRLTENFREFSEDFPTVNCFLIHPVYRCTVCTADCRITSTVLLLLH